MTATRPQLTIRKATLREMFVYTDWARDRIFEAAAGLNDAQLDRPFEMGMGSLRETVNHIWAAERVWLDRWTQSPLPMYRASAAGFSLGRILDDMRATAAERNEFLAARSDSDLGHSISYKNLKGQAFAFPLGVLMLHVANHGQHHRGQALNMLRHSGAALPKPGPDYIFMKLAEPGGGTNAAAPPALDLDTLKAYLAYGQWAQRTVLDIAAKLSDAQLDRKFEMGCGTLRSTLSHIRFAEQWWLQNWTTGPSEAFPETDPGISIAELQRLTDETIAGRDAYLRKQADADLTRFIKAQPRPDVYREFPLGVILLQIGFHGTHHRAQAVNMLRHVGATVPGLDVTRMFE